MILDVQIDTPQKAQQVLEYVIPYVVDPKYCIRFDHITIYVPDGIDPNVRNDFIVFVNKINSKGDK